MRVTAHLDSAAVGLDAWPTPLDGPLSWAYAARALSRGEDIPPAPTVSTEAADFPLPLSRWRRGDWWGWRSSRAHFDTMAHTAIEVRRKPATGPMSVWTLDAKHHTGLGPMKARNVTRAATLARTIWWDVEATNPDDLADLLSRVTHLGARHNAGSGHVSYWSLDDVDGDWSDRDWPPAVACRAPYWHPSRRQP
nr:MAG TPA: Cas system-associated RAMP superfamily protein [Caudoviricetes sp.]